MARTPASRLSTAKILRQLREAGQRGDRASLTLAVEQMRTLALSPRYWERYFTLLRHPLARLIDLLVIKQGERIAHQKGWKLPRGGRPRSPSKGATSPTPSQASSRNRSGRPGRRAKGWSSKGGAPRTLEQPSLFEL